MARRLLTWLGVWVEDERYSLTVHYRESPDPQQAATATRLVAEELGCVRHLDGKCCLNILPEGFATRLPQVARTPQRILCAGAKRNQVPVVLLRRSRWYSPCYVGKE